MIINREKDAPKFEKREKLSKGTFFISSHEILKIKIWKPISLNRKMMGLDAKLLVVQ